MSIPALLCVALVAVAFLLGWLLGANKYRADGARERWAARRKFKIVREVLPENGQDAAELVDYFVSDYEYRQEKDSAFWRL